MDKPALAQIFYRELQKVVQSEKTEVAERLQAVFRLIRLLVVEVTREERLQFTTLFARMAYVGQQYRLSRTEQYFMHSLRREVDDKERGEATLAYAEKLVALLIERLLETPLPEALSSLKTRPWPEMEVQDDVAAFIPYCRAVILADRPEEKCLVAQAEQERGDPIQVEYGIPDRNEHFQDTIELIRSVFNYPTVVSLLDSEVSTEGIYRPKAIVIEPDHLVDVTAIAESFQNFGLMPEKFLLTKFLPFRNSLPLLRGHIANFFLDQLLQVPDATFKDTFRKVFQLNPLAFCLLNDRELRELRQKTQRHFLTLKEMVQEGFKGQGIEPEACYLEPSFCSNVYGIQGRLDVLYQQSSKTAIVELKSGKPFRPNIYGLSHNHYIQTLLYDLLIRTNFGSSVNSTAYILYSGEPQNALRYAPASLTQQYDALRVRNLILGLERRLMQQGYNPFLGETDAGERFQALFGRLSPSFFSEAKGYVVTDLQAFEKTLQGLSKLERAYFASFAGFLAREHKLAKTGQDATEGVHGQAALWLESPEEKMEAFALLNHLQLIDNQARSEAPTLTFFRTEKTIRLANFRIGDIAVLYPEGEGSPLRQQLFKCSIVELNDKQVTIRLRSPQFNDLIFQEHRYWNLEHDLFDSSFNKLYQSLFTFAQAPEDKRALLLGLQPPAKPAPQQNLEVPGGMTKEQADLFRQILAAPDYFLLWGPPGTGKTSVMLKQLAGYLFDHSKENLLLLAYTNRAVDEICEAVEAHCPDMHQAYLRIGSRFSTDPRFADRLLVAQTEQLTTRKELRKLIENTRIIIGTVASVLGKPELFELKQFHRVIIDEASQLLEPQLVGLLPKVKRFVLIGDHKQLPAVVVQHERQSAVTAPALRKIGLTNLRNSYFERLLHLCQQQGWDWAYGRLSRQGRMHERIMEFPNRRFYEGGLQVLPDNIATHQRAALSLQPQDPEHAWQSLLCRERVLFLDTPVDDTSPHGKTNQFEAEQVVELVKHFQSLYAAEGQALAAGAIGIITPYRAQIAQIQAAFQEAAYDPAAFTIDTVERYQGGARKIIIISLCTNRLSQLQSLQSLSEEGVDRRLNVALTRAREHLVLLGNQEILKGSPVYRDLIEHCRQDQ